MWAGQWKVGFKVMDMLKRVTLASRAMVGSITTARDSVGIRVYVTLLGNG